MIALLSCLNVKLNLTSVISSIFEAFQFFSLKINQEVHAQIIFLLSITTTKILATTTTALFTVTMDISILTAPLAITIPTSHSTMETILATVTATTTTRAAAGSLSSRRGQMIDHAKSPHDGGSFFFQ